jgi:serine/threonine protein kinase
MRSCELDGEKVERVLTFSVHEAALRHKDRQQYWVSIEKPEVNLQDVAESMTKKGGYWNEPELRRKYAAKVCSVLRLLAKSLCHLHSRGVVHGDLCLDSCGKFDNTWKVLGRMEVQIIGEQFDSSRFQQSFPPEALYSADQDSTIYDSDTPPVFFRDSMIADPSIDIWAFGKLAFEAVMGKPLVEFEAKKPSDDVVALLDILEWNEGSMKSVFTELLEAGGIAESGAELFTSCLFPRPADRPASMEEILSHPFWKENQKTRDKTKKRIRRRNTDSISVFTEASKSLFTETSD